MKSRVQISAPRIIEVFRLFIQIVFISTLFMGCTEEKEDLSLNEYDIITGQNNIYKDLLINYEKSNTFYLPKLFYSLRLGAPKLEDSLKKYNNTVGYPLLYLDYKYSQFDSTSNKYKLYYSHFDDELLEIEINKIDYLRIAEKINVGKLYFFPIMIIKVNNVTKLNTDSSIINKIGGEFKNLLYRKRR